MHRPRPPTEATMNPASQLGQRILPMLQGWAGRLKAEYPAVRASALDLGRNGVALDCILPRVALGLPDHVTLAVTLRDREGTPTIQSAEVVWGHPSGHIEAQIEPPCGELTPELIEQVADGLPELFAALRQAIRRGRPPG